MTTATGWHSTSISVVGPVAALLGQLRANERGVYVSHLLGRDTPLGDWEAPDRHGATVLRLRLSAQAREVLAGHPNASACVERYVAAAWADACCIGDRLYRAFATAPHAERINAIALLLDIAARLGPTRGAGLRAGLAFALAEPSWGLPGPLPLYMARGELDTATALRALDLHDLLPTPGVRALLLHYLGHHAPMEATEAAT